MNQQRILLQQFCLHLRGTYPDLIIDDLPFIDSFLKHRESITIKKPRKNNKKTVIDVPIITQPVIDVPIITQPEIDVPIITQPEIDVPIITQPEIDVPIITQKKPRQSNKKKNTSTLNQTAPENDIISELVNLANGTDFATPIVITPAIPIKAKRKYIRKKISDPIGDVHVKQHKTNDLLPEIIIQNDNQIIQNDNQIIQNEIEKEIEVRELILDNISYLLDDNFNVYNQLSFHLIGVFDSSLSSIRFL